MRFSRLKLGGTAVGLLGLVTVAACGSGGGSGSSSTSLAATQTLKFPVYQPPGTWDPGEADAEVDTELMQNIYDNLWRFRNGKVVHYISFVDPAEALKAAGLEE